MTIKELEKKLLQMVEAAASKETLNKVGKTAEIEIKSHTRDGLGVKDNGDVPFRLPNLKSNSVNRRRNLRKAGKLSSETSPGKANNTKTGRTVSSVDFRVNTGRDETTVGVFDNRSIKVVRELAKGGREFIALSSKEIVKVTNVVNEAIIGAIKKLGL